MNYKKAKALFLMCVTLVLTGCRNGDVQHPEIGAYTDLLEEKIQETEEPLGVTLITLDDDDTYELVIFEGDKHNDGALLYTYKDKKAVPLAIDGFSSFGSYGALEIWPNKGILSFSYDRNGGYGEYQYFLSLKDGKISLEHELQLDVIFTEDGGSGGNQYYSDGKEISEEEYNSIIDSYDESSSTIVSYESCSKVEEPDDIATALTK